MSNELDPDHPRCSVRPYLGQNYWQRSSTDDKILRITVFKIFICGGLGYKIWSETKLTLNSIIMPLKYQVCENITENGAFALLEQMLHFP